MRTAELSLDQEGAWLGAVDLNHPLGDGVQARLNAVYERLDSFRDVYGGHRIGINPTLALVPDDRTRIDLSYEYDSDRRVVWLWSVLLAPGLDTRLRGNP